jgi:hypothetical protein
VIAIRLGRASPTRLDATYPPARAGHTSKRRGHAAPLAPAYLVLLRAEIAAFHPAPCGADSSLWL